MAGVKACHFVQLNLNHEYFELSMIGFLDNKD